MLRVTRVPEETEHQARRVCMQPTGGAELVHHGHEVVVESWVGRGTGLEDAEYEHAEAWLVGSPDGVFEAAELIVRVEELIPEKYDRYREGEELFALPKLVSRVVVASMPDAL
jgi:alanine dehydrogenase